MQTKIEIEKEGVTEGERERKSGSTLSGGTTLATNKNICVP